jgi:hypothetical protein
MLRPRMDDPRVAAMMALWNCAGKSNVVNQTQWTEKLIVETALSHAL